MDFILWSKTAMKIKVKRSLLTALCLTLAAALLITGCTGNGETAGGEADGENKDKDVYKRQRYGTAGSGRYHFHRKF